MEKKALFLRNFKKYYNGYLIISLAIAIFEVIFIIRGIILFNFSNWRHLVYFYSYIFLFVLSLITFLILLLCRQKNVQNMKLFSFMLQGYTIGIILWAMIISFLDWTAMASSGSPIVYLTVIMGIAAVTITRPRVFLVISLLSMISLVLGVYIYDADTLSSGMIMDMIVFELTAMFISYKSYSSSAEEYKAVTFFQKLSKTDQLTDLGNRRSLDARIDYEYDKGEKYVFVLVDIDFFKEINDEYGHGTGDEVLLTIATTMKKHFPDNVYRYGGDEIVIISDENVGVVWDKLIVIQKEITSSIASCNVTISFGIYNNTDNKLPKEVFNKADKALYKAKGMGRSCGYIYHED